MPWLSIETGEGVRMRYELNDLTVSIGRGKLNAIVLADPKSSAQHCVIRRRDDGTYGISDAASRNGTYVNGEPLNPKQERHLHDGDVIAVGQTTLRFLMAEPQLSTESEADLAPTSGDATLKKGDTTKVEGLDAQSSTVLAESANKRATTIFDTNGRVLLPSTAVLPPVGVTSITEELPKLSKNHVDIGGPSESSKAGLNVSNLPRPSDVIKSFDSTQDVTAKDAKLARSSRQSKPNFSVPSSQVFVPAARIPTWWRIAATILVAIPLVAFVVGMLLMRANDAERSQVLDRHFRTLLDRFAQVEGQLANLQRAQQHAQTEIGDTRSQVASYEEKLTQFRQRHEKVVAETEGLRDWLTGFEKRLNRLEVPAENGPISREMAAIRSQLADLQQLVRQLVNATATPNSNANVVPNNSNSAVENHPGPGSGHLPANLPQVEPAVRLSNEPRHNQE